MSRKLAKSTAIGFNHSNMKPSPPHSRVRTWLTATRPFAYTASALAVLLGGAIAFYTHTPIQWPFFALTLLGVLLFHTAANLLNDCFDHQRGLDRDILPMSGAVVRGWITEKQAFQGAMVCLAGGISCGIALTVHAGWPVLVLGIVGAICALGYTTPRFCFKYSGRGDAVIFLAFGFLPVFGTWWVQTGTFAWLPILWSIPLAMLAVAILHSNNWRDLETDAHHDCKTIAGLLGPKGSRLYFQLLVLGPFGLATVLVLLGLLPHSALPTPPSSLIVWAAFPFARKLARQHPEQDSKQFHAMLGQTSQLHLIYGLLSTAGFLLARVI